METTEWLQRTAGLLIEAQIRRLFQGLEEHRVCDLRIFFAAASCGDGCCTT